MNAERRKITWAEIKSNCRWHWRHTRNDKKTHGCDYAGSTQLCTCRNCPIWAKLKEGE